MFVHSVFIISSQYNIKKKKTFTYIIDREKYFCYLNNNQETLINIFSNIEKIQVNMKYF